MSFVVYKTKIPYLIPIFVILIGVSFVVYTRGQNKALVTQNNNQSNCKHGDPQKIARYVAPPLSRSDCQFSGFGEQVTIAELDKASCQRVSKYIIVDKNRVYKQLYDPGSSDSNKYIIVTQAQASTFVPLQFDYYKDASRLFYDTGDNLKIIKGIDLASLEVLSTYYLKDKNRIYFIWREESGEVEPVSGFDIATFTAVENEENSDLYFKDKNGVYFQAKLGDLDSRTSKIAEADTTSFEVIDGYAMGKDKNYVYRDGKIVEGADPQTFEVLGSGYFKDKNSVYTVVGGFRRLPGIDGCSFELVDYDPQRYQWWGYSKDENQVYYQDWIVEDADPATFKVDGNRAFDKKYEFKGKFKVEQ